MNIHSTSTITNELLTPSSARSGPALLPSPSTTPVPASTQSAGLGPGQGTEVIPFNAPSAQDFAAVLGTYTDTMTPGNPATNQPATMPTNARSTLSNSNTSASADGAATGSSTVAAGGSASGAQARSVAPPPAPAFVDPQLAQALNKQTVAASAALMNTATPTQQLPSSAGYGTTSTPVSGGSGLPTTVPTAQQALVPATGSALATMGTGTPALSSLPAGATIAYVPVVVMPVAITPGGQQGAGSAYLAGLPAGSVLLAPGTTGATSTTQGVSQTSTGAPTGTGTLSMPFSGSYDVTQPFGPTIFSVEPAYHGYTHFHTGVDYALPMDTPVLAAADGTVEFAGHDTTGFGTMVMIRHADGTETLYGHLHSASVTAGTPVLRGQQIGLSGNSGNSTGPHLHFGVRENGDWVDPQPLLQNSGTANQTAQPITMGPGSTTTQPITPLTTATGGGTLGSTTSTPAGTVPSTLFGIISAAAQRYGVDPALVQAVIRVESNFNPNAVSPAGAQGLMQLTPSTARSLGVTNAFDPTQSMQGVAYLRQLLDKFGGNVPLAIAAYNAGPTAVTQYGGIPPYAETRQYVQRVLNYRDQYANQEANQATSQVAAITNP